MLVLICCGILFLTDTNQRCFGADTSSGISDFNDDEVTSTLLIQGLERPVRLRLICFAGDQSWKKQSVETQSAYMKALFTFLDSDGNGSLSREEVGQLAAPRSPRPLANGMEIFVAFNFRVLDTDGNGVVSPGELESYLSTQGETATRFTTVTPESGSDVLFRELDTDGDRMLTESETSQANRLFERDLDGNQVLATEELRGRSMGRLPPEFFAAASGNQAAKGTLHIRHDQELATAASPEACIDILIHFTGTGTAGLRASDDGSRIRTSFARREIESPLNRVKINSAAEKLGFRVEENSGRDLVLRCGQRMLVLRVLSSMATSLTQVRQSLQQEFDSLSVSLGATASVSASADMSPALKATFPLADRNGNDQLEQTELQRYLDQLAAN